MPDLDFDANLPMPVLLRGRPYVYATNEKSRTPHRIFLFYPEDLVSAIYWHEEQNCPVNELVQVSELPAIRHRNPHLIVRLPGVIDGELDNLITDLGELHTLLETGVFQGQQYRLFRVEADQHVQLADPELRLNRAPVDIPLGTQSIADLLRHFGTDPLSRAVYTDYLQSRHTENYPSPEQEETSLDGRPAAPQRIGYRGNDNCVYLAAEQRLKQRIDLDMTETSSIFVFGLFDGGNDARIARWLKDKLPRCLLPEFFSVERTSIPNMHSKVKNCFMQLDMLLNEDPDVGQNGAGCSAAVAVYLPAVRLVFLVSLGLVRVKLVAQRGGRHDKAKVISASPERWASDEEERRRIEQSGRAVIGGPGPSSTIDGVLTATRGFGHFAFKSTEQKPYSRARGAVSAVPDVSTVRLSPGERMWLAIGNADALDSVENDKLADLLYGDAVTDKSSAQSRCRTVLQDSAGSPALLITELCAGGTRQPPL